MQDRTFSIEQSISFGWDRMKKHIGFFIILLIGVGGLSFFSELILRFIPENQAVIGLFFSITYIVVSLVIHMGLIKVALRITDENRADFNDMFSTLPLTGKLFISAILYALIVIVGCFLLIIPGIIWAIQFWFFDYFIVDRNMGPIEALKKSSEMTRGNKMNIFLLFILLALINAGGVLCLGIGLFATIPTAMTARAYVYRVLSGGIETVAYPENTIDDDRVESPEDFNY